MADCSWYEISRRSVTINKYEEILANWHDTYLTVHIDKTLRILEFSLNLRCIDKKIDCIEYSIKAPIKSPASELLNISRNVNGIDLAKMTMNPALWPHSVNIIQTMCDIISFEWSPRFLLWNNDYLLAVLNNIGHVEFYRKNRKVWDVALDLSAVLLKEFKEAPIEEENPKQKQARDLDTITKTVYSVETSAICWASNINDDYSAYFLTAQKNGTVLIWTIREDEFTIKAVCIDKINTEFNEIIKILWICMGSKVFITCSNSEGQLFMIEFNVSENKKVTHFKNHVLWSHKDRMAVQHCSFVTLENKILLVCVKNRFLLIQLLNNEISVLSQNTKNLNDYKISSICKHKNHFYCTTVNGCVFQINYKLIDDTLDIQYEQVILKDYSPTCDLLYGGFSQNGVLLAVGVIDRKILYRKHDMKFELIYYDLTDSDFPEFSILLNNSSKKLTSFADCIEKLRYKILKSRRLPQYDYNRLLSEGETDAYKLKIFFIIRLICNVLEENFKIERRSLPEISLEVVKEKIALAHAKTMLTNIYEKFKSNQAPLTEFETETFVGCKKYIEIICKKNNSNLDISNEILHSINKECNYTCQCCDKSINGFSCEDGHLNAFCSVTFTPIESEEYLICKCGATANSELLNTKPMCIFCDLYFDNS